jgi:hypothetical protein
MFSFLPFSFSSLTHHPSHTFQRDSPTSPWLYADATIKNPFKNMQPVVKPTQRAVKTLAKGAC